MSGQFVISAKRKELGRRYLRKGENGAVSCWAFAVAKSDVAAKFTHNARTKNDSKQLA